MAISEKQFEEMLRGTIHEGKYTNHNTSDSTGSAYGHKSSSRDRSQQSNRQSSRNTSNNTSYPHHNPLRETERFYAAANKILPWIIFWRLFALLPPFGTLLAVLIIPGLLFTWWCGWFALILLDNTLWLVLTLAGWWIVGCRLLMDKLDEVMIWLLSKVR